MLDLVFAVSDTEAWHTENLSRFPHHYSFLQQFGPKTIASIQENYGAGLYYNTLVDIGIGRRIKYGVISTEQLCSDLEQWTYLYTSGRMHKPITVLQPCERVHTSMQTNYHSALYTALLLLLPSTTFTIEELYMKIAGLSYTGDFRMILGENPKKVENIVLGNFDAFQRIYQPLIQESAYMTVLSSDRVQADSTNPALWSSIPLSNPQRSTDELRKTLSSIVARSSRSQSIKGIFTAGMVKSAWYIAQKVVKK